MLHNDVRNIEKLQFSTNVDNLLRIYLLKFRAVDVEVYLKETVAMGGW